ncbi:MAG: GntR family transcriptional regulator, partial [Abditibacteriota bacterium]|nr:GntR family transcriptional regulator [Abditibacteriota bacterium]
LKFEIVKEEIKKLIDTMEGDSILPSYSQFARDFNVSDITVRKALTELSNEGLIYGIRGKGVFVAPKHGVLRDVHIMSHFISMNQDYYNDFYPIILEKLQEKFIERKLNPIYSFHRDLPELEQFFVSKLIEHPPYGVVIIPSGFSSAFPYYQRLHNIQNNMVFLDIDVPSVHANLVSGDSYSAVKEMTENLDLNDYQKICILSDDNRRNLSTNKIRINCFKNYLKDNNITKYSTFDENCDFETYKYRLLDYINYNVKKYKKICIFSVSLSALVLVFKELEEQIKSLDKCLVLSTGRINLDRFKNVSLIWAEQNVDDLSENVANIIDLNGKDSKQVYVPFKVYRNF